MSPDGGCGAASRTAPYSLLDIRLVLQNTSAGSTFLRWRTRDFARMGVAVWERQVSNKALPQAVREDCTVSNASALH
jgi:hypothetical protein